MGARRVLQLPEAIRHGRHFAAAQGLGIASIELYGQLADETARFLDEFVRDEIDVRLDEVLDFITGAGGE